MSTSALMTLGGFAFKVNEVSTPRPATRKARALMAFLIMNRDADVARERLLDIFWPDADPERARDSLKTALWSIRRCLRTAGVEADAFIPLKKSVLRWIADTAVDALQFAELAALEDAEASREALQLYRGDFLEGDYDNWAVAERERLATLYETVLGRLMRSSKDTNAAVRFIERNPYDEEAYATLIEAELAAGRRSSAASWIDRCRKALSDVGDKPSSSFEARFGNLVHIEPVAPNELLLPFAGREAELALVAAKLANAVKGVGSVTLVHGEAGIGKSTLLNRVGHVAGENGLHVVTIQCAGEIPSMFGPWQEFFGAVGGADFETFVRAHASDLATAVAQAISARLVEPAAIIIDDVHELTGAALDIFVALSQTASSKQAVVAGLRPEGVSVLRSRLADVAYDELPIGRLDRSDLQWALAQVLGGEQPDVLDILYDRTGGHPLFFAGLLNSLVDTGVLVRDGHPWHFVKPIDANVELPNTVKRFIETRLHARGENARSIACALALEPAANADDLGSVLHMDESTVLDSLDDLLALGLITQPASGPQFAFSHDLVREVAAAGLNVGRRTSLHRAFAQRLRASEEIESSLRLARHLHAAGEPLAAAQSYLKSAGEALELNAAQDAIDRAGAGIQAVEKLERTATRDILLVRLQRTAARAAIAAGNVEEAIRRAREAVALARAGGDPNESTQSILDLAVMEGAAYHVLEQKSDAAEARQNARLSGDDALEAQALVQQANALRELGLRDEALQACSSAQSLALRCGRADIAQTAMEESLRTQMTWWLFDDALATARAGLDAARRVGPLDEAAFLQVRCALWYLLERFDEAQSDEREALRIANDAVVRRHESRAWPTRPVPLLQFACHYMAGKIAIARSAWNEAIDAAQEAASLTNVAKLPRYSQALSLLRIEALLQRNSAGDCEIAHELIASMSDATLAQGIVGWSDCVELARARVAARLEEPDADALLRRALNTLEENAHRAPLEADRAFARLAEAASEVGEAVVANRARGRSRFYRSRRLGAAGAAWGGGRSLLTTANP